MMNEGVDNNSSIRRKPSNSSCATTGRTVEQVSGDPAKFCQSGRSDDVDAGNDADGDPQSFLSEGNKHFLNKRFICAINSYSQGLKRVEVKKKWEENGNCASPEKKPIKSDNTNTDNNNEEKELETDFNAYNSVSLDLFCNRALTYISIGNYAAALEDTKQVLSVSPTHFKAIHRQAKALAGLAQYQDAINCVNGFLKHFSNSNNNNCESNKKAKKSTQGLEKENLKELYVLLDKLNWKKRQSETGEFYDTPFIMDNPFEPAPEDWVEYIGPVKVELFPGKGRGLVATQDLPASTLVLASRAFEIIFLDEKSKPEKLVSEESKKALHSGEFKIEEDDVTLNLLARKIYDRLQRNPEKRADFYRLHAGNDLGFLDSSTAPSQNVPPLDMARIYGICKTNTFANSGDSYPEVEKSVGVWLFPAFVNHQCIGGNCTWKIFGDFIFLRTYKNVKKGEEIIHSYVSPGYPFKARTEVLTKRLGFVCTCVLCELDRKLPPSVHEEKDKLRQLALNQEVKFTQLNISEQDTPEYVKKVQASILLLEQIITKLEKLQPDHGVYNASLLDPLQKLGLKYFSIGDFQTTVKVMERVISLMKISMLPHAIADCTLWIIASYLQMGNGKQAKKWGKVLRENLMLAFGDTQVLKTVGPWAIEPMKNWGYL